MIMDGDFMPIETGGVGDKRGNIFEYDWVIYQLLKVINEELSCVVYEPIDAGEADISVFFSDGRIQNQQCKISNGSHQSWRICDLSERVLPKWKIILENTSANVALVSPIPFQYLTDLCVRANDNGDYYKEFVKTQIEPYNKEFKNVFNSFCNIMQLKINDDKDIIKCINYLNRIEVIPFSIKSLSEIINEKIKILFSTDYKKVYDCFKALVCSGDIFRKKMDINELNYFIRKNGLTLRNLANDYRVFPSINNVNKSFTNNFNSFLDKGIFKRSTSQDIYNQILNGNWCVLEGNAGMGKSGCINDLISLLDDNSIPYIALKLDRISPKANLLNWSKELGLIETPGKCLHAISKEKNAVLILDQLDTLRWIQTNSNIGIEMCREMISEIKNLNKERKKPISIILVCRSFDLISDHQIKKLIYNDCVINKENIYKINNLTIGELQQIIPNIDKFPKELIQLLSIPSNLYIWKRLKSETDIKVFGNARSLIEVWMEDLIFKAREYKINESDIQSIISIIIENFKKNSITNINVRSLKQYSICYKFLVSEGFLLESDSKICFFHQSLLDYFLVDELIKKYDETKNICAIIGPKTSQTPKKRYFVKILLEMLLKDNTYEFVKCLENCFYKKKIRFSFKFLFFELLSNYDSHNSIIDKFIIEKVNISDWREYILWEVVDSNPIFVETLIINGFLEEHKVLDINLVLKLLISIDSPKSKVIIDFIESILFKDDGTVQEELISLFSRDPIYDNDCFFDLRLKLYSKHPHFVNNLYFNISRLLKCNFKRAIDMIKTIVLNGNINKKTKKIKELEMEEAILESYFSQNYLYAIDKLLPLVPKIKESYKLSNWKSSNKDMYFYERLAMVILKKANKILIQNDPNDFISKYNIYMQQNYLLHKELILDAFRFIDAQYSDFVLNYLSCNFDNNYFEKSSEYNFDTFLGNQNVLIHSKKASKKCLISFQNKVLKYIESNITEQYKYRKANRKKSIWSWDEHIWGHFQYEVLSNIESNLLIPDAKKEYEVLKRSFKKNKMNRYSRYYGSFGYVSSPVSSKTLSLLSWKKILLNTEIPKRENRKSWIEVKGGFLESTIEQFASSFTDAVKNNTIEFINMMFNITQKIDDSYIISLYYGVETSPELNNISNYLLERLFYKYSPLDSEEKIKSFCRIIMKKNDFACSKITIDLLQQILIKYKHNYKWLEYNEESSANSLFISVINSILGVVYETIGQLISKDLKYYDCFRKFILFDAKNDIFLEFSLFFIYTSLCKYDFEKYAKIIVDLTKNNIILLSFPNVEVIILDYFKNNINNEVKKMVYDGLKFQDIDINNKIAWIIGGLLFHNDRKARKLFKTANKINGYQMLKINIKFLDNNKLNSFIKKEILNIIKKSNLLDYDDILANVFLQDKINYSTDMLFVKKLMKSKHKRKFIKSFLESLQLIDNINDYSDLILDATSMMIESDSLNQQLFGMESILFTYILAIYTSSIDSDEVLAIRCLDILDKMYEKRLGTARQLFNAMIDY